MSLVQRPGDRVGADHLSPTQRQAHRECSAAIRKEMLGPTEEGTH